MIEMIIDKILERFNVIEKKNGGNIGRVFGRLTVMESVKGRKGMYYKCQCSCGQIKDIAYSNLISGRILSCGCLKAEQTKIIEQEIVDVQKIIYHSQELLEFANQNRILQGLHQVDIYGKPLVETIEISKSHLLGD